MSRWARKVDKNHGEIRDELRRLGFSVADTHRVGGDFPDLVVANTSNCFNCDCEIPRTVLVEVKSGDEKPTTDQQTFLDEWPGESVVAYTIDDVIQVFDE